MRRVAMLSMCLALLAPVGAQAVHSKLEFVQTGPVNQFGALGDVRTSHDGAAVWFGSGNQLVPEDTDSANDVYMRAPGGQPTLLSTGPSGGNAPLSADLVAVAADGSRAIFETQESLTPDDADAFTSWDVYEWSGGTTTLLSVGPEGGNGSVDARFAGTSADATRVFFHSWEHLVAGDEDTCFAGQPEERPCTDLYARAGGTTTLISTGSNEAAAQDADAAFLDASADGAHAFFETQEALVAQDTDGGGTSIGPSDIYERTGAVTSLVSTSSLNPNQVLTAEFGDVSQDGTRVFFRTQEQLTADDTDGGHDIFERASGSTTRISQGSLNGNTGAHAKFFGITPDGAHVFFDTPEQLEAEDDDVNRGDLYRRSGSETTLISTGPVPVSAPSDYLASSLDGQRVYFRSVGQFTPDDTDSRNDIYERFAGAIEKISPGDADGPFDHAVLAEATDDASRLFYADDAGSWEYWNGEAYEAPASPVAISVDGGRAYLAAHDLLGGGESGIYLWSVDGAYPRPKGATPVQVRLVPAYEECTAPNREHGPPLAFGSCNPPQQASDQLTVGTADSNGQPTKSEASLRLDAVPGAPATPADEADVQVTFSITDVRRRSDLADYTGNVQPQIPLRITDRNNTPAPTGLDQGTGIATDFVFDAPCAATADTTIGATCAATTSFDAIVPGAVKESERSVWELGQPRVADDDPAGRATFMVQGVFVP